MTKKLWIAPLLAAAMLVAACSSSSTTDTTPGPDESQQVDQADTSTVTGDLSLTAPQGAASSGYAETELTAPSDKTFTIAFENDDEGVPHNMQITDADGKVVFEPKDGETITGVETTVYNVEGLDAGTYGYNCQVHPTVMKGTLTVG